VGRYLARFGPRRLALGGADLVLMAMHAPWKGAGRSNNALLAVECDGSIAPDHVRAALDRFLDVCPWPAARLRRFPLGKLHWAAGRRAAPARPHVRHCAVSTPGTLHALLEAELGSAIDPSREPPVRFLIADEEDARGPTRSTLVLTWFHPLMDPRGAQTFLAQLSCLDQRDGRATWGAGPAPFLPAPADPRPLRERGRQARRSLEYMRTLAVAPPVSPGTGRAPYGPVRFRQESFAEREGGRRGAHATRAISWRLAIVGKAMAELWRRRGLPDTPFLLPVSADLRPKGEPGPMFGNQLAFHFARFRPSETGDVAVLARALRRQMASAVRDGQIEANRVAMDFLQYRPVRSMLRALPWTSGGEVFSFNCADIMDLPPALARCFGRRVQNAYHVPAIQPRPGIGVFFNRCAGTNNLVVSWVEGAVDPTEVARIVEVVREGMGWISIG
jgi:hypothetical protein